MPTSEIYKKIVEMNTPEMFVWIRETKNLRGLTNKQISDATRVPEGTVGRVTAGKPFDVKRSTLQPIVAYLAQLYEETLPPDTQEQAELNTNALEGLKMVVQLRDAELEAMRKMYETERDRAKYLETIVAGKDRWIRTLAIVLGVITAGIIAILIYDLTHHDVGWYQPAAQWFDAMGMKM